MTYLQWWLLIYFGYSCRHREKRRASSSWVGRENDLRIFSPPELQSFRNYYYPHGFYSFSAPTAYCGRHFFFPWTIRSRLSFEKAAVRREFRWAALFRFPRVECLSIFFFQSMTLTGYFFYYISRSAFEADHVYK